MRLYFATVVATLVACVLVAKTGSRTDPFLILTGSEVDALRMLLHSVALLRNVADRVRPAQARWPDRMANKKRQSGAALAFSRREKQILDAVYAGAPATVGDVLTRIPHPPGYSAVRAMLARLEEKGFVRHEEDGSRYVYYPTRERVQTRASLLERIVDAYFDGSPAKLVATVLDRSAMSLSERELDELAALVDAARARGSK